jgi:hypothetical protein
MESQATSVASNDEAPKKTPTLTEQFGKQKADAPRKNTSDTSVGSKSSLRSAGSNSVGTKKSKIVMSGLASSAKVTPKESLQGLEGSLHGVVPVNEDEEMKFSISNTEATLKMLLTKSAPNLGLEEDTNSVAFSEIGWNSSHGGARADPSGSVASTNGQGDNVPTRVANKSRKTVSGAKLSSPTSSRRTVKKMAVKASDLGIDLANTNPEKLGEAVKKWKADQLAKTKPDPGGKLKRSQSRGRGVDAPNATGSTPSKLRSKSTGREINKAAPFTPRTKSRPKSRGRGLPAGNGEAPVNRTRSKSRSGQRKVEVTDLTVLGRSNGKKGIRQAGTSRTTSPTSRADKVAGSPRSPTAIKRKIIVRRRASLNMSLSGHSEASTEDLLEQIADLKRSAALGVGKIPPPPVARKSPSPPPVGDQPKLEPDEILKADSVITASSTTEPKTPVAEVPKSDVAVTKESDTKAGVDLKETPTILDKSKEPLKDTLTISAKSKEPITNGRSRSPLKSSGRGRIAKACNDANDIQKRLREAGVSDEQYRAMLAVGLSVSLAI